MSDLSDLIAAKHAERRYRFAAQHGAFGLTVLDILIRHDLAKLIRAGAPPVQYTTEARPICERIGEARSEADVRRLVHSVFVQYFHGIMPDDEDVYRAAAADIWQAWLKTQPQKEHRE